MPEELFVRVNTSIPQSQRNKTIVQLIEAEVLKREKALYDCAVAVENDKNLKKEMREWDVSTEDDLQ